MRVPPQPDPGAGRPPSARSFALDLLSTVRRGAMPVRALLEAAALFGIAEGSVRVSLSRLAARGLVERDERGHYRLGTAAAAVQQRVSGWRRLGERMRPWSGGWLAVFDGRAGGRARGARRRGARARRLLGFRRLGSGLFVRPDNLAGGVRAVRGELGSLGLEAGAWLGELRGLDDVSEARLRALWDADDLAAGYRRLSDELAASARRLAALSPPDAMVESFLVGGRALRALAFDPLLPEPIVDAGERAALIDAMRRYDALGRSAWAEFLARHGVPHRSAPADTRTLAEGGLA